MTSRMIDSTHRRAVSHYQQGTAHHWVTALAAARIVNRRNGATGRLAHDLARSHDTVEGMARAGVLYTTLRKACGLLRNRRERADRLENLRDARRQLSVSHWTAVASAMYRMEFSPMTALQYLTNATVARQSVRELADSMNPKARTDPDFPDMLGVFYDRFSNMADNYPPDSREAETLRRLAGVVDQARAEWVR
jgi:hypothetical protein